MTTRPTTLALALGFLIATSATARAQAADAKEDGGFVRSGVVFSMTGGWGTFVAPACEGCTGQYYARSFGLHLGGVVSKHAALLGGFDFLAQEGRSIGSLDLLVRWFFQEQLWGDLGIGAAYLSFNETGQFGTARFDGTSVHLAVGADLVRGSSFALEASIRAIAAYSKAENDESIWRVDGALTFQFGATWY